MHLWNVFFSESLTYFNKTMPNRLAVGLAWLLQKNNNPALSPDWWPTETITFLKSLIFITFFFFYCTSLIGSKLKKKKKKSVADNTLFPNHVHICIVRVRYMLKETFAITADVEKRFIPKKTTTAAF